jgi:hypothetical protein
VEDSEALKPLRRELFWRPPSGGGGKTRALLNTRDRA